MAHIRLLTAPPPWYCHSYADEKRKLTDVICIILGVLFGLILFIVAIVLFNSSHLSRTDYPADAAGNVCLLDAMGGNKSYPFLYFEDIESPDRRRFLLYNSDSALRIVLKWG
jgi:hypothetical protein